MVFNDDPSSGERLIVGDVIERTRFATWFAARCCAQARRMEFVDADICLITQCSNAGRQASEQARLFHHLLDVSCRSINAVSDLDKPSHLTREHMLLLFAAVKPISSGTRTWALDMLFPCADHLVRNIENYGWLPTTGMEATLPMMLALANIGRNDVAYRLLHNDQVPLWNFAINNGATTIWGR